MAKDTNTVVVESEFTEEVEHQNEAVVAKEKFGKRVKRFVKRHKKGLILGAFGAAAGLYYFYKKSKDEDVGHPVRADSDGYLYIEQEGEEEATTNEEIVQEEYPEV